MSAGDILTQLKKEHEEVKDLFAKAEDADSKNRAALLEKIEKHLIPHARGEEKSVYAIAYERTDEKNAEDDLDQLNEAYEEHHAVDVLLSELKKTDVSDETWLAKLTVIKENVEHHIEEEEEELFPLLKKHLSKDELSSVLDAYLLAKEQFEETLPTQKQIASRTPSSVASKSVE